MDFSLLNKENFFKTNGELKIQSQGKTDFFRDPISGLASLSAPFYYVDIEGDFILSAEVEPNFLSTYDAGCLMAWVDEERWCKFCFELTDLGYCAIVSVNTNKTSDDCNGVKIDSKSIYMKISRKGSALALHYSFNGHDYFMHRLLNFTNAKIKLGFVAQSPTGEGNSVKFQKINATLKTIEDIRKG